jgi:hypothetical protein
MAALSMEQIGGIIMDKSPPIILKLFDLRMLLIYDDPEHVVGADFNNPTTQV